MAKDDVGSPHCPRARRRWPPVAALNGDKGAEVRINNHLIGIAQSPPAIVSLEIGSGRAREDR